MATLAPAGPLTLALAGGALGALGGLVPGLHPNTIATGVLLLALDDRLPRAWGPPILLGVLGAWTFASIVPLVVLGVPEGEDAPALLPGQRLARRGHASAALAASARGSLIGLGAGALAALGIALLLAGGTGTGLLPALTPWVQALALAVLVASDPSGLPRAGLAAGLAGALGHLALATPVPSPLGAPSTPLAPLFIGLFGLPALRRTMQAGPPRPPLRQLTERPPRPPRLGAGLLGTALGVLAGAVSGFTSGPATAIAVQLRRRSRDEDVLATTSAVNTATACVATGLLHAVGRTRTGVHAAQLALVPPVPGVAGLTADLTSLAAGALPGLAALVLARASADPIAAAVPRVAPWLLWLWLALVAASTGPAGLVITAAAWALARAAARLGARRSVLMACLLVPALIDALPVA